MHFYSGVLTYIYSGFDIQNVQPVLNWNLTASMCQVRERAELICDRCQDADEIMVATMEIAGIGELFALCGTCARQLPRGFHVA
jgi:hypothetical protein